MVALNHVQKLIKLMMDVTLAEASLLKFVWRLHQALKQWEVSAKEALLKMPAMKVDETSLIVDKKNHWIHVYSAGDITLKCLDRERGIKAINAIKIVPRYGDMIIHDCCASYFSYQHCGHDLCGSHLMRELTFVVESNGYAQALCILSIVFLCSGQILSSSNIALTITHQRVLIGHSNLVLFIFEDVTYTKFLIKLKTSPKINRPYLILNY